MMFLVPALKASVFYYNTTLQIHNYAIFDLVSKETERVVLHLRVCSL